MVHGFAQRKSATLENLRLEDMIIIARYVQGTKSYQKSYKEFEFCTQTERRKRHNLISRFIRWLTTFIQTISQTSFHLTLQQLIHTTDAGIVSSFRTGLYYNSVFLSTSSLWNNPPVYIQENSLSKVKRYLTINDGNIPSYYYSGKGSNKLITADNVLR